MKQLNVGIQVHADALVKRIREILDRYPDTPVIECAFTRADNFRQQTEALTLDIGGERGNPDRLEIVIRRPYGEGPAAE